MGFWQSIVPRARWVGSGRRCGSGGQRDLDISHHLSTLLNVNDVTRLLEAAQDGNASAAEELLPLVYDELRKLAARRMTREAPGHTLQPTALVHEAWLRLLTPDEQSRFQNRSHFFAAAAEAMRRILIDCARRKMAIKRGGHLERVDLDGIEVALPLPADELIALDEALDRLQGADPRAAEVVKLCFFAGLSQEQASKELGISLRTTERSLAFGRAWLFREVKRALTGEQ
jgi:RNA polymerase sigma factor (TIGR02999 family)